MTSRGNVFLVPWKWKRNVTKKVGDPFHCLFVMFFFRALMFLLALFAINNYDNNDNLILLFLGLPAR